MEQGIESRPRRSARDGEHRVAALLTGNLAELPALGAAASAASHLGTGICVSWVGPDNPGRFLIRELIGGARVEELDLNSLYRLLRAGGIRSTVVPATLWRRTANTLWPLLSQSSLFVCRRGKILPSTVLLCADSDATEAALVARLTSAMPAGTVRLSVLRVIPPPPAWALALGAMSGLGWVASEGPAANRQVDVGEARVITAREPTVDAIRHAWQLLSPELVVLGWHHHLLPLPARWLHPTAWRLSNQLASDVLLVPA